MSFPRKKPLYPSLSFAAELHYCIREYSFANYMKEFYIRYPILYFLWYRWWFLYSVPECSRSHVLEAMRTRSMSSSASPDFVMCHPVLSLIWLVLCFGFQFFVKLLTAPIQIIRAFKCKSHRADGFDEDGIERELTQESEVEFIFAFPEKSSKI